MRVDVHQELACDRHGGLVEVREQSRMLGKTKRVQIQIVCPIKSIRGSILNIEYSQSTYRMSSSSRPTQRAIKEEVRKYPNHYFK